MRRKGSRAEPRDLALIRRGVVIGDSTAERRLAEVFAEVARSLLAEPSLEDTLNRICDVAVEVVPGCRAAGTSVVRGRKVENLAATGPTAAPSRRVAVRVR